MEIMMSFHLKAVNTLLQQEKLKFQVAMQHLF